MQDHESEEAEHGHLAVPGRESHESEETLSPDELGTEDEPSAAAAAPTYSALPALAWATTRARALPAESQSHGRSSD